MSGVELKLKQASAVLGVPPKDLQNLVQFGVVKPRRRGRVFWFDRDRLVRAKVAFYLKESLGASTPMLARFVEALFGRNRAVHNDGHSHATILSRPWHGSEPVQITVPLAALAAEVERRLPLAGTNPDQPRGRSRPGWSDAFLDAAHTAAQDLSNATSDTILDAVRAERKTRRHSPKVGILVPTPKEAPSRRR